MNRNKKESLSRAKLKIYNEIVKNERNYSSFSPIQKLEYIEKAFENVNEYYSHLKFGLDPNYTKFGFILGPRNAVALNLVNERAICYNIKEALTSDSPLKVYEVMFHEFSHVWQDNACLFGKETPIKDAFKPFRRLSDNIKDRAILKMSRVAKDMVAPIIRPAKFIGNTCLYQGKSTDSKTYDILHGASINEIVADMSSYKNLDKILKEGLLKFPNSHITGQRMFEKNRREWKENAIEHASDIGSFITSKMFALPQKRVYRKLNEETTPEPEPKVDVLKYAVLSAYQASNVIKEKPELFANKIAISKKGIREFREHILEKGYENHMPGNFFGTFSHRSFRRFAEDPNYARYDTQGCLKDKEEIMHKIMKEMKEIDEKSTPRVEQIKIKHEPQEKTSIKDSIKSKVTSVLSKFSHQNNELNGDRNITLTELANAIRNSGLLNETQDGQDEIEDSPVSDKESTIRNYFAQKSKFQQQEEFEQDEQDLNLGSEIQNFVPQEESETNLEETEEHNITPENQFKMGYYYNNKKEDVVPVQQTENNANIEEDLGQ